MAKTDKEIHQESMQSFIKLANELAEQGASKYAISAGLMTASCVYATFIAVGNKGVLSDEALRVISEGYKNQLEAIQKGRKEAQDRDTDQQVRDQVDQLVSFPDD